METLDTVYRAVCVCVCRVGVSHGNYVCFIEREIVCVCVCVFMYMCVCFSMYECV